MKAVIVRSPGKFGLEEVEAPPCPDAGILIKVLACGLCGSDLRTLRTGHHRVKLPFIIGHEVCGEIIETGPSYSGSWKPRDRLAVSPLVYCGRCEFCRKERYELCSDYLELAQAWPGGLAEYMAIPAEAVDRGTILKIPDTMDPTFATLVEPLSSVVHAQEKGDIGQGDTLVIIGAGPIGALHLHLARSRGADTILVADISKQRLKMMEQDRPDFLLDAKQSDIVEEVRRLSGGMGADVIITANPDPETQIQAVEMAKKGGRILVFGGLPPEKATPGINMNTVHYRALSLIGTTIFAPRHNAMALKLIAEGRIPAEKIISHRFALSDFKTGADLALAGEARKVVFNPYHYDTA